MLLPWLSQAQQWISLEPVQDATLYETLAEEVQLANGAGEYLFTGRVEADGDYRQRRALLQFDLAGALPAGARIVTANLSLWLSRVPITAQFPLTVNLHRVLTPWSEGPGNAPAQEGQGTLASDGDTTWWHSVYDTTSPLLWQQAGGDFDHAFSAQTVIGFALTEYTWTCSSTLLIDLQTWLDNPLNNHGWMLLVNGNPPAGAARRFASREAIDPTQRPRLEVFYYPPEAILTDSFETPLCPDTRTNR